MRSKYILLGVGVISALLIVFFVNLNSGEEAQDHGHDHDHAAEHHHDSDAAVPLVDNCAVIGKVHSSVIARFEKLVEEDEVVPENTNLIFQEIGREASVQSIYSPFVDGESPGDRAVVVISQDGPQAAANDFLSHNTLSEIDVSQISSDKQISELYCAAHHVADVLATGEDHLAFYIFTDSQGRDIRIEYLPDVNSDDTFYEWTVETDVDVSQSDPPIDKFCELIATELGESNPEAITPCVAIGA